MSRTKAHGVTRQSAQLNPPHYSTHRWAAGIRVALVFYGDRPFLHGMAPIFSQRQLAIEGHNIRLMRCHNV